MPVVARKMVNLHITELSDCDFYPIIVGNLKNKWCDPGHVTTHPYLFIFVFRIRNIKQYRTLMIIFSIIIIMELKKCKEKINK